jgi:hypothetical protein
MSRKRLFILSVAISLTAIVIALTAWSKQQIAIKISISIAPYSLIQYDDHAGHFPKAALVEIRNDSDEAVWFNGVVGVPFTLLQQHEGGSWGSHSSSMSVPGSNVPAKHQWAPLRSHESMTVLAGPVSDNATELRVGMAFSTDRRHREDVHFIFSPIAGIVSRPEFALPQLQQTGEHEDITVSNLETFDAMSSTPP